MAFLLKRVLFHIISTFTLSAFLTTPMALATIPISASATFFFFPFFLVALILCCERTDRHMCSVALYLFEFNKDALAA